MYVYLYMNSYIYELVCVKNLHPEHNNLQLNNNKNPFKNLSKDLNRCSIKENIQMATKYIKKFSTALVNRKMQI